MLGFLRGSAGKESDCNVGDLGSILGLGRCPGEGKGSPLQYSGLENSLDCMSVWGHKESDRTERLKKKMHAILTMNVFIFGAINITAGNP